MFELVWSIVACIGALLLVVGLVYAARAGNGEREEETAAREFFRTNGHWPDEPPRSPAPPG